MGSIKAHVFKAAYFLRRTSLCSTVVAFCFLDPAVFSEELAPPAPNQPWSPPGLDHYESELAQGHSAHFTNTVRIDPEKTYALPELIDLAERSNPDTRIAWEKARAAAAAVGLSQSAYYPFLAASAVAGYERAFLPFPSLELGPGPAVAIKGGGTLTTEAAAEGATLNLKWLLFDFGERKAATTAARARLMAANVGFNAVHQQIVFEVTRRFYELDTARQKVVMAKSSLDAATTVAEAAHTRQTNGLATTPEVLQAEQQTAQAEFDLEAANGEWTDARVALIESLGLPPAPEFHVADASRQPLPEDLAGSVDELIGRALAQRPDLVIKLADLHASEAQVRAARAAYYPKISLAANVGMSELDVSVKDSSYFGGHEPVYGAGLAIGLPLFDGFERAQKLRAAEAERRAAESALAGSRDAVVREVWKAYTDFKTALHKQESAARLLAASQNAFEASLEAYRQGLGTYVAVVTAQRNLTAAQSVVVDTRSAIFTSQTALALSIGDLAKPPVQPIKSSP